MRGSDLSWSKPKFEVVTVAHCDRRRAEIENCLSVGKCPHCYNPLKRLGVRSWQCEDCGLLYRRVPVSKAA